MTQREYEDYMYEESDVDDIIVVKSLANELFLQKLQEDAIASHYELLAERYDCVN